MHRLGIRNAEVSVISDELIKKAVCTELDPINCNAVDEADQTVDFLKLQALSLSFRNILKVNNLETLRNLVKLQLDNNVIQEIDGIGHLVQLQWLDLSFNNISTIKGLDSLVNLTDLSLYNNNIAKLENLDNLKKLQVLSIGNNSLAMTEGLLYLKTLESLRVLNLSGNPVCSDPEYRPFILAHLDKLQYLDYALVDRGEMVLAREQYQDELEELKEVKAIEDAALAREAEHNKYLAMLRDANVIILETLVSDMFKEDTEMSKIEVLPGLRNIIDDYHEKAKAATEDIKTNLLDKHAQLTKEVELFRHKYDRVQVDAQKQSIDATEEYRRKSKPLLKGAMACVPTAASSGGGGGSSVNNTGNNGNNHDPNTTINNVDQGLQQLQETESLTDKLHLELMNLESDLVEIAQELITGMESCIDALGTEARDLATEHFRAIEALENTFFESVSQLAVTLLERMASEDAEDDDFLSDECRAILNDRDALNNAINGSHDIHIGKLLAQEDLMREQSLAKIAEIIKTVKDEEWSRNRSRVAEIINIKEKNIAIIVRIREEISRVDEEFY